MVTIYSKPEKSEKKIYKGEAEASAADKKATGGEKFMQVDNVLFQSDIDAETMATALLARLETRKEYIEMTSEFMPIPVERRDTVIAEERVTHDKDVNHTGLVRGIKLNVTNSSQTLTLILEE